MPNYLRQIGFNLRLISKASRLFTLHKIFIQIKISFTTLIKIARKFQIFNRRSPIISNRTRKKKTTHWPSQQASKFEWHGRGFFPFWWMWMIGAAAQGVCVCVWTGKIGHPRLDEFFFSLIFFCFSLLIMWKSRRQTVWGTVGKLKENIDKKH